MLPAAGTRVRTKTPIPMSNPHPEDTTGATGTVLVADHTINAVEVRFDEDRFNSTTDGQELPEDFGWWFPPESVEVLDD